MTTVTKTVKFDAAHVLTGHRGPCGNLHGHTYRVDVSAAQAADGDMVIDFRELKGVLAEVILDRFDHSFICNTRSEVEREIAAVVEKHGMRTVAIPFRSTVENLARMFYDELKGRIPGLAAVKVWETADNCAEFRCR